MRVTTTETKPEIGTFDSFSMRISSRLYVKVIRPGTRPVAKFAQNNFNWRSIMTKAFMIRNKKQMWVAMHSATLKKRKPSLFLGSWKCSKLFVWAK